MDKLLETVTFRVSPRDKQCMLQAALVLSIEGKKRIDSAELYRKAVKEFIDNYGLRAKTQSVDTTERQ